MSHVSRPVKASVPRLLWPPPLASALEEEDDERAESVVEGAELDVGGVAAEFDGAGELVELEEVGAEFFRLLDCDGLDGCDPAEPPPFAHASGSTYCWSPAETPGHDAADADAEADAESPATPMTTSQAMLLRHPRTGRSIAVARVRWPACGAPRRLRRREPDQGVRARSRVRDDGRLRSSGVEVYADRVPPPGA